MKKTAKMSLTGKLTLGGIIAVLLPVVCIGIFSALKVGYELDKAARARMQMAAGTLADMIQLAVTQELNVVKGIAVSPDTIELATRVAKEGVESSAALLETFQRKLSSMQAHIEQNYETLVLINREGKVFADSQNGKMKGINTTDRDYFKEAIKGKDSIGNPAPSKATGNPIFQLAVPVFAENKEVVGVMAVIAKVDYLGEKVAGAKQGLSGYAYVVDRNGTIFVHPDKEQILKTNITKQPGMEGIAKSILAQETGERDYILNNEHKTAGYAPVHLTGWSVIACQSVSELMGPVRAMQRQIALIAGFFLVVIGGIVFLFGRRISKPILIAVDGLMGVADQVATAASHISTASEQLAEGSSEQASSIEETSASLEEMSSITKQTADNAGLANKLMVKTTQVAGKANQSMEELTASMSEISKASEETSKIIKTIDEIAFQTNLLALNAAVEAARAGEAGAGFAVVADEVRNLAMRAAEAAKNTANLIEGTVRRVKEGSELVAKTDREFREVTDSVGKSGELVGEISAASQEQARGIEQINKAANEMDRVVQQNAGSSEETASSSEEMSAQAERMKDFVGDLVRLVGSRNFDQTAKYSVQDGVKNTLGKFVKEPAKALSQKGMRKIGKANGKAGGTRFADAGKRPQLEAEQIIPFDEGDIAKF